MYGQKHQPVQICRPAAPKCRTLPLHYQNSLPARACVYIYTDTHAYVQTASQLQYSTIHYVTVHYVTSHYITLHYITLHYSTVQYSTLHYIDIFIYMYIHIQICIHTDIHTLYMHKF